MAEEEGDVIIKGSDYLTGIDSTRQSRGVVNFDDLKKSLHNADEDYKVFLKELFAFVDGEKASTNSKISSNSKEQNLEGFEMEKTENAVDCNVPYETRENGSGKGVDVDKSDDEIGMAEEEDDYDPDFMLFSQNLKPCGNAYVLTIARRNATLITKYEDEDEDEFQLTPERRRKAHISNPAVSNSPKTRRRKGFLREAKNLEIGYDELQVISNPSKYSGKNSKRAKRNIRYYSSSNVPALGVADVTDRNGKRKSQEKEKNEPPNCRRRLSRGIAREHLVEDESSDDLQEEKSQRQGLVSREHSRSRGRLHDKPLEQCSKGERNEERVQTSPPHKIDKIYAMFLSKLKMDGESPVYVHDDGTQYRYADTPDSNTEVSAKPPPSSGRMSPESSKRRSWSSVKRIPSQEMNDEGSASEFRKRAMEILLKPYNRKEHCDLLKEAKLRRPVCHYKEMRNRSASFPDEVEVDKSYLDRYSDLNREIDAAQRDDPCKALHLLRGLFFYLQCVCMEGSFIPWKDNSWLEAMQAKCQPRSRTKS